MVTKNLMRLVASIAFAVMLPSASHAQGLGAFAGATVDPKDAVNWADSLTPPLPTAGERKAAEIASWVTVIAAVVLDARATIGKCDGQDNCYRAVTLSGVRVGATLGATALVKHFVQRTRPCAKDGTSLVPVHGYNYYDLCGVDNPDASFYSGHTALAFSTIGGPRLAFALPLAVGTGGLRIAAGKHWLTDTIVGAGVGLLTSRIR